MAELFVVSDEGDIMLSNSTWFLSKLILGLVVRLIEGDDE
jgi:uncharacterized protein (DUF1015 family)